MTRARDERPGDDDSHEKRQDTGAAGARPDDGSERRHATASDARLTALLRADTPTAYTALRELRERHHPSVLAYARLCAASESSARELATQAFTVATRETARGTEPGVPWRHQLLLLAFRVAATWTTDEHATGLAPTLRPVLDAAGPDGPVPPLLAAFQFLPPRPQGLIWYGVVEQEPDDRTAVLLGLTPDDVTYKRESALQALRQACLRVRLAASDDPRCQDFRRLIEESVRPDTPATARTCTATWSTARTAPARTRSCAPCATTRARRSRRGCCPGAVRHTRGAGAGRGAVRVRGAEPTRGAAAGRAPEWRPLRISRSRKPGRGRGQGPRQAPERAVGRERRLRPPPRRRRGRSPASARAPAAASTPVAGIARWAGWGRRLRAVRGPGPRRGQVLAAVRRPAWQPGPGRRPVRGPTRQPRRGTGPRQRAGPGRQGATVAPGRRPGPRQGCRGPDGRRPVGSC